MLNAGNSMFLFVPNPTNDRILHPGKVIEADREEFRGGV